MITPIIFSSSLIWLIYLLNVFLIQKAFQFNLSLIQTLTTNPISLNWITIVKIGTIIKNYFVHYWFYGVLIINSVLFLQA